MISLFSPFIPPEAGDAVKAVIDSGWINTGSKEKLFRDRLRERFGFPYCVATSSCTGSLRASLALLGVGAGDEVITTPWTMPATSTVILEQGAKPVFADIEYDTLNINPESIAQKITDKTKAIMCVHYAGAPCDLDEIRKFGIPVVEDAAQALGAKYNGKYVGSSGELVNFSFQAIKVITSGDGGAVTTDREDYYRQLKMLIWFGIDKEKRLKTPIGTLPHDIEVLGFKYNMNDITATLGLVGLKHFDDAMTDRYVTANYYMDELDGLNGIELLHYPSNVTPAFWMFPIHVKKRLNFAEFMRKQGIEVSVHYRRNDAYTIFGGKQDLPVTEKADGDVIHLPMHSNLKLYHVEYIIGAIKEWCHGH